MVGVQPKKLKFVDMLTNHRTCRKRFVFANELNGANMSLIVAPTQYPGMTIGSRASAPSTVADAARSLTKVAVKDTLENLKANIYKLQANIKNVASIELTDATLSFNASDLIKYKNVIDKISGNRSLTATDVSMAYFDDINRIKNVSSMTIKDSTNNIQNNIVYLISKNSKITSITRTNTGAVLTVDDKKYSLANVANGVLSKMGTLTGLVNLTGVAASDAAARASGTDVKINKISVADSLSNIVANADTLTRNLTKINYVSTKGPVSATMDAAAYKTFLTGNSDLIGKIANSQNPNALNKAFVLTGATSADSQTTGLLGADSRVRSINVNETIAATAKLPATNLLSSKVTRVDLTLSKNDFGNNFRNMIDLGSKLASVKISDSTVLVIDPGQNRDKSLDIPAFKVISKTQGSDGNLIGLEIKNAELGDVSKMLTNKQINKAEIVTTAKDLLDFSSDGFAAIPVANTITITLADNATNINDNAAKLAKAITTYNDKVLKLQVADTAEKLGANIDGLQSVVNALKSANLGNTAITIDQTDNESNVKVSYAQYTTAKDALEYIKADLKAAAINANRTKYIEIDAGANATGVAKAVLIGGEAIAKTNYTDVAKVNISFNAATAITEYNTFAARTDDELKISKTGIAIGATVIGDKTFA